MHGTRRMKSATDSITAACGRGSQRLSFARACKQAEGKSCGPAGSSAAARSRSAGRARRSYRPAQTTVEGSGVIVAHAQDLRHEQSTSFGLQQEMQTHRTIACGWAMRFNADLCGLAESDYGRIRVAANAKPAGKRVWLHQNAVHPAAAGPPFSATRRAIDQEATTLSRARSTSCPDRLQSTATP